MRCCTTLYYNRLLYHVQQTALCTARHPSAIYESWTSAENVGPSEVDYPPPPGLWPAGFNWVLDGQAQVDHRHQDREWPSAGLLPQLELNKQGKQLQATPQWTLHVQAYICSTVSVTVF
jgi:hypothetical protein